MICNRLAILLFAFLACYLPAKASGAIRDSLPDEQSKEKVSYSKGFFVGLAFGAGLVSQGCTQCYPDPLNFGYYFRGHAGYRFNRKFAVAIEPGGWAYGNQAFKNVEDKVNTKEMLIINLSGYYFPFPKNRLFLKGTVGMGNFFFTPDSSIQMEDDRFTTGTIEHIGICMGGGIGINLPVSPYVCLVPSFEYSYMPFNRLETLINEPVIGGLNAHLITFSVGVSYSILRSK